MSCCNPIGLLLVIFVYHFHKGEEMNLLLEEMSGKQAKGQVMMGLAEIRETGSV